MLLKTKKRLTLRKYKESLSPKLLASAWCRSTQPPPGLSAPRQPGPLLSPGNSSYYLDIISICVAMFTSARIFSMSRAPVSLAPPHLCSSSVIEDTKSGSVSQSSSSASTLFPTTCVFSADVIRSIIELQTFYTQGIPKMFLWTIDNKTNNISGFKSAVFEQSQCYYYKSV